MIQVANVWAFVSFIAVIATTYVMIQALNHWESVKKHQIDAVAAQVAKTAPVVDLAVYDLHKYTDWLNEKGCLREGFVYDKVVSEYVA